MFEVGVNIVLGAGRDHSRNPGPVPHAGPSRRPPGQVRVSPALCGTAGLRDQSQSWAGTSNIDCQLGWLAATSQCQSSFNKYLESYLSLSSAA